MLVNEAYCCIKLQKIKPQASQLHNDSSIGNLCRKNTLHFVMEWPWIIEEELSIPVIKIFPEFSSLFRKVTRALSWPS